VRKAETLAQSESVQRRAPVVIFAEHFTLVRNEVGDGVT
jgi:hypothetical protein